MRSFLSLNQRKGKHSPALAFPQDSAVWFPWRHQLPDWGSTFPTVPFICAKGISTAWKERGESTDWIPKVVAGSDPPRATLHIKNLPQQHQMHTWESPQLCLQVVLSALARSPPSLGARKEHGETPLAVDAHGSTPTWTAVSRAFGLPRRQGSEEQPEINWSASSEQPAIKRFYWSSQFSPTWLPTNEHTAPLPRAKDSVARSRRFPSLGTQCSSSQLCEQGKCKLQPLVTPNKKLPSLLFSGLPLRQKFI